MASEAVAAWGEPRIVALAAALALVAARGLPWDVRPDGTAGQDAERSHPGGQALCGGLKEPALGLSWLSAA